MNGLFIEGKEYKLKYTLESWKQLKKIDITPTNFQEKLEEDPAEVLSQAIYFGLNIEDRKLLSIEKIDKLIGFEVLTYIQEAMQDGLPKVNNIKKK